MKAHWYIAVRPAKRRALETGTPLGLPQDKLEQTAAGIQAKIEYPFPVLKRRFPT